MPQRRSPARHLFPSLCFGVVSSLRRYTYPKAPSSLKAPSRGSVAGPGQPQPAHDQGGKPLGWVFGGFCFSCKLQHGTRTQNSGKFVVLGVGDTGFWV